MPSTWLTPHLRDAFPTEAAFREWYLRLFGVEPKEESDDEG